MLRILILSLLSLFLTPHPQNAWAGHSSKIMAEPSPPSANPHPPQTREEQRRVDFGLKSLDRFAASEWGPKMGKITEQRFAHIVPWAWHRFSSRQKNVKADSLEISPIDLKEDEFLIHIYVRYEKTGDDWYHLDVIVSEDEKGVLSFRGFYTIPMPSNVNDLPSGVVC